MSVFRAGKIVPLAFIAATLLAAAPRATAGVVVDGTRVVYPAAKREVTININNPGSVPSLVQAWLDAGDPRAKPGDSKVPFVLTPPLFRLDPTKVQSLRLVYTHDPLPADRESVFWLNVLDIPPRAAANAPHGPARRPQLIAIHEIPGGALRAGQYHGHESRGWRPVSTEVAHFRSPVHTTYQARFVLSRSRMTAGSPW